MAKHYGTAIIPARIRKLKDKPNAESRRYELTEWKQATVQFNYHTSVDGMLYSFPYEYICWKVDIRITGTIVEVFCKPGPYRSQAFIRPQRQLQPHYGAYAEGTTSITRSGTAISSINEQKGLVKAQPKSCPQQTGGATVIQSLYGTVKNCR